MCAEEGCDQFAILGLTDESYEWGYKPVCLDHFEEHLDDIKTPWPETPSREEVGMD